MYKIQHIIEYIENVYKFNVISYKEPINNFEYFKQFLYKYKLFNFLSKISPVKYKSLRFNKFINSILFEIEIIPTMDSEINLTDYKKIFEPIMCGNYKVKFNYTLMIPRNSHFCPLLCLRTFPINYISGIRSIDANICDFFPEFKGIIRDYKLKDILNNV